MVKIISAQEAVSLIPSGCVLGVGGFGGWGGPDELLLELGRQFRERGAPRDLTLVAGISPGDLTEDGAGLSHIKDEGIVKSIIAAHVGMSPAIGRAVGADRIAGYTIPLGVYGHLLRALSGRKPGVITHVGLHTFADPRLDGCMVNQKARAEGRKLVELMEVDGREYLFYRTFPIDMCILRGTYADEDGNISLDEEPMLGEQLELATAVHNSGGTVIVQVKDILARGTLHAKRVHIHNCVVDYVVKARPENHRQGYDTPEYRPQLTGDVRIPLNALPPMPLGPRKIVGRRGALDLRAGALINLGIGIPDGVAAVAAEEGIAGRTTLAIEGGTIGGVPVGGVGLGACVNPEAIYRICDNFDLYDGGGLDMAFLGAAQIDREGNVNVSKFGPRCTGPGGFINITQNTPVVCFMGTFTAGKMDWEICDGALHIKKDAPGVKFVERVEQVTFSARYARETGQQVSYVTERAVFQLTVDGLMLTELAPGVDLQRDVLDRMAFTPLISPALRPMDARIFRPEPMGLAL